MEKPVLNHGRYESLDSLRGIAALTVVLMHLCLLFVPMTHYLHTPLRFLARGREAVTLFFVLSGFVLFLQLESSKYTYIHYAIRRICRIYLPYLAAIAIGVAIMAIVPTNAISWGTEALNSRWHGPATLQTIMEHVQFLAPFNTGPVDPVVWSLVYEMRISLIFPLIYLMLKKIGPVFSIAVGLALSVVALLLQHKGIPSDSLHADLLPTIHFTLMFIVGASIANYRKQIAAALTSPLNSTIVLIIGVVVYLSAGIFTKMAVVGPYLFDWITTLGVVGIISCAIAPGPVAAVLRHRILAFFGAISYSVYLLHHIVIDTIARLVGNSLPTSFAILIAIILITPAAYGMYRLIEFPAIHLGRVLASRSSKAAVIANQAQEV